MLTTSLKLEIAIREHIDDFSKYHPRVEGNLVFEILRGKDSLRLAIYGSDNSQFLDIGYEASDYGLKSYASLNRSVKQILENNHNLRYIGLRRRFTRFIDNLGNLGYDLP